MVVYLTLCLLVLIMFVIFPQLKIEILKYLDQKKKEESQLELNLVLIIVGSIMIVLGMPSTIVEMAFGLISQYYFEAVLVNLLSMVLYLLISYYLAVTLLKNTLREMMNSFSYYKAIHYFIQTGKFYNIMLLRLLHVPMFIKNYCIPIFEPDFT